MNKKLINYLKVCLIGVLFIVIGIFYYNRRTINLKEQQVAIYLDKLDKMRIACEMNIKILEAKMASAITDEERNKLDKQIYEVKEIFLEGILKLHRETKAQGLF